jgi:choline dehydrogenase-like flavoprotein
VGLEAKPFRHNRIGCLGVGFCMLGCAFDRKQAMHLTYVPRAQGFGARLFPDTTITGFEVRGRELQAAYGVTLDRATGQRHACRIRARRFVVAGGGISTPLLLLKNGLANSSTQLGKNLRLHPTGGMVADMGREEIRFWEGLVQATYVDDFLRGQPDRPTGYLIESIYPSGPGLFAAMLPDWGTALHREMARFSHLAAAFVQVRDGDAGRLTVSGQGTPIIDYSLSRTDADRLADGYRVLGRMFLAAGAERVRIPHVAAGNFRTVDDLERLGRLDWSPGRMALISAHQMGTCRMGEDRRKAVVDSRGKVHDLENLYVADASVFPTALGVNPQITIASLATTFAAAIAREHSHA